MKKILLVAVSVLSFLVLTACGSNTNSQTTAAPTVTETIQETTATAATVEDNTNSAFPYTFTDVAGREVTIEKQPERFIVGNYIPDGIH